MSTVDDEPDTVALPRRSLSAACPACGRALPPGMPFCTACGVPMIPAPRGTAAPAREPGGSRRWWVVGAVVLVAALVAAAVVTVLVLPTGTLPTAARPAENGPTAPTPAADPASALAARARADAGAAEATVGSWVPQLSSKRVGTVADGRTYDAAAILADHERLRAVHQEALLVFSGDYTSFRGGDYWVTVLNRTFPSAADVTTWCARAGLDADHCYAKRLSHTGDRANNTVVPGQAPGQAAPAVPVLGAVWGPDQRGYGDARPAEVNAGGDGTSVAWGVSWQSWGGPTATGRGSAMWVAPGRATYQGVEAPAVVVASNLGDCHGRLAYRSVGWYFPSKGEIGLRPGDGYEDICDGP